MHGSLSERLFNISKTEIYRFSEEPFTLASGQQSHHYFNCKKITLIPDRLSLMAEAMIEEIFPTLERSPEAVGGLTLGADPIAYALSLAMNARGKIVYPLIVRKESKEHGLRQRIEGEFERIGSVLVVDDVITTAGSTLKAVRAFREQGLQVGEAICILDREEGGEEALIKEGIRLTALFKKSDFL